MANRIACLLVLSLAIGLAGCPADPDEGVPVESPRDAELLAEAETLIATKLEHVGAVFEILQINSNDCIEVVESTKKYLNEHKDELKVALEKLHALQEDMSELARKKVEVHLNVESQVITNQYMEALTLFSQNCPNQIKEFGKLLEPLSMFK